MNKINYKMALRLVKKGYFLTVCEDPTVFVTENNGIVSIRVYDNEGFLRSQYVPTYDEVLKNLQ